MAERRRATRGAKPAISYSALHNLSNVLYLGEKAKGRLFEAERLIYRRIRRQTVCIS